MVITDAARALTRASDMLERAKGPIATIRSEGMPTAELAAHNAAPVEDVAALAGHWSPWSPFGAGESAATHVDDALAAVPDGSFDGIAHDLHARIGGTVRALRHGTDPFGNAPREIQAGRMEALDGLSRLQARIDEHVRVLDASPNEPTYDPSLLAT